MDLQLVVRRRVVELGEVRAALVLIGAVLVYHAVTFFFGYASRGSFFSDIYRGSDSVTLRYALAPLSLGIWWLCSTTLLYACAALAPYCLAP